MNFDARTALTAPAAAEMAANLPERRVRSEALEEARELELAAISASRTAAAGGKRVALGVCGEGIAIPSPQSAALGILSSHDRERSDGAVRLSMQYD